jgi:co-chaperonin GroES (HSP10)
MTIFTTINKNNSSKHTSSSSSSSSRFVVCSFDFVVVVVVTFFLATTTSCCDGFPQPKPQYNGGGGVGRFVLDELAGKEGTWNCHYDMVLVERLQKRKAPQDVEDGVLYVPDDDLPRLHLCKVLSIGPGREEENGMVAPDVNHWKVGDTVIAKNPWGIGPKDEELPDGTKLSFMRAQDIAATITGGVVAN